MPCKRTTAIIATKGRIDKTDSTLPLLEVSVLSVTKALNAASFAVLPKKVMMQSKITINTPASIAPCAPVAQMSE